MNKDIDVAGRRIGPGHPVYIVAEVSANHGGSYERAVRLVREAKAVGADAVKLQTYTPDTITIDSDKECFRIGKESLWGGRTLYDLYKEAFTPWEWQPRLKAVADELGMALFSSPFDFSSVEFLEKMDVPAYKVASFELVDLPLIEHVARKGKPLIFSTGMASRSEIEDAVSAAGKGGLCEIALLKCTSAYPSPPEEMNLRTIPDLIEQFHVPVGLSDHTPGVTVPVVAVSLGAQIVEKHLTLSREDGGPDSAFSLEPSEFRELVTAIRTAERALGTVIYGPSEHELVNLRFRRSLFITEDIPTGTMLGPENVRSIRPAEGLPPRHYEEVLGRRVTRDVEKGTPLRWDMIAPRDV